MRGARHYPSRERQVLLGARRRRGAGLLRRPRRRPLRFSALLPREATQDDEPVRTQAGAVPTDSRPLAAAVGARVQHFTRHREGDGARERRGGAVRAGVRGGWHGSGPLRAAGREGPGRRPSHALPRAAATRPRLRLRGRGAAHHRLGLGAEPVVAVGSRPSRGRLARRLGLERGQLRAAAGADELVHGARAGVARASLSACDMPSARAGR